MYIATPLWELTWQRWVPASFTPAKAGARFDDPGGYGSQDVWCIMKQCCPYVWLAYLILGAIYILFLCCFLFFISFQRYLSDCLSQNLPDRSSPDFEGWWNYGCRWLLEIAFRSPKEHHYIGNQFLLVLSTELISVTPVVQPGGLTLGFALHLHRESKKNKTPNSCP